MRMPRIAVYASRAPRLFMQNHVVHQKNKPFIKSPVAFSEKTPHNGHSGKLKLCGFVGVNYEKNGKD